MPETEKPAAPPSVPAIPAHWTFPAHPSSARRARKAVEEALPAAYAPHVRDELALLTSELVTNALRHGTREGAQERVELVAWPADGCFWLAVSDPGEPWTASLPRADPGPGACGGRGLLLVDTLCAAWAVLPRPVRGKSVVAGCACRRPRAEPHPTGDRL